MSYRSMGLRVLMAVLLALPAVSSAPLALAQDYAARPGDVLDVLVIGEPDLSRLVTVSPEGNLFLPVIGNVQVQGLTLKQIEERLVTVLRRYVKDPKVVVTLRQAAVDKDLVYALGQVLKPGPYEHRPGWTVAELLTMAGGPGPRAALRRVVVLRRGTAIPVNLERLLLNGDASQNHELKPGDVLIVPEINERVLLLGEVTKPGYQDLKDGDRLLDIITRAGGPTIKAAPEDISVMRNGGPIKVSLEVFLRDGSQEHNILIEAGDVIHVPETDRRVLVMGEVQKPGRYVLEPRFPSRVLDVVMQAGGPIKGAKLSGSMVIRQNGEKPGAIPINLDQVLKNGRSEQNIVVKPGDVVFVPPGFPIQLKDILETFSGIRLLRTLFGLGI